MNPEEPIEPRPASDAHASPGADASDWDFHAWEGPSWGQVEELSEAQLSLQQDLSCLVDGELDEGAAARAMVMLEEDPEARSFFDDIQRFARHHRDLSEPHRLEARVAMLGATEIARAAENIDLAHRLATIFYQLGKAYTLAAADPEAFQERVFERAVPIDQTKAHGRGLVDGVVDSGRAGARGGELWGGRDDWTRARHMLNGRLEQIADPMEKGRRLLEQATEIDPSHEESRIYLAYVLSREGKTLRAAALYRDVFDTAMGLENRGHAAMQLGRLHFAEGAVRQALVLWRWVTVSGLAAVDQRFNIVRFNIGIAYASLGLDDRALASFRTLMDRHVEAEQSPAELARLFVENGDARAIFESRPGFVERLTRDVPELLAGAS
ncbi:MAG: hypothetical protein VX015_04465 [Planctomycetota bacterium]|nr:hypothetical protein [Planctomycetota bacterium]